MVCFILFPLIWIFFPSMFAFPVDIIFSWFIFLNPLSSSSYLYSSPFPLYLFSFLSSHYFAIVKFPGFSSVSHPLWGTSHWWLWSSPPEGPPCDRDTLQWWQGHLAGVTGASWAERKWEHWPLARCRKPAWRRGAAVWRDLLLGSKGRDGAVQLLRVFTCSTDDRLKTSPKECVFEI